MGKPRQSGIGCRRKVRKDVCADNPHERSDHGSRLRRRHGSEVQMARGTVEQRPKAEGSRTVEHAHVGTRSRGLDTGSPDEGHARE